MTFDGARTKVCIECGFKNLEDAEFCSECGKPLKEDKSDKKIAEKNTKQDFSEIPEKYEKYELIGKSKCINCKQNTSLHLYKKNFLLDKNIHFCTNCGLTLEEAGDKFLLSDISDRNNRMWTSYKHKFLTMPDWERIANGGMSSDDFAKVVLERLEYAYVGTKWNMDVIKNDILNGNVTEDSLDEYVKEAGNEIAVLRAIDERVKDPLLNQQAHHLRETNQLNYSNYEEYLKNLPEIQKNELLKTGELIIYVQKMIKQGKTESYYGPKGLTDIIGGYYGQTSVRMEHKVRSTPAVYKWIKYKIILGGNGFTISDTGEVILYDQISSIKVDKTGATDMGLGVVLTLKNKSTLSFRTPITLGFETLIKEKIGKNSPTEIITNDKIENLKENVANQNESQKQNSREMNVNNAENSFSNADELMKYAELYEKGLLTEEEFTAIKKKLLGL